MIFKFLITLSLVLYSSASFSEKIIEGKSIINSISKKIAISAGSACTTQMVEPSHVLLALGLEEEKTHSAIRIGCGRFNTDEEIKVAADEIANAVKLLAKIRV